MESRIKTEFEPKKVLYQEVSQCWECPFLGNMTSLFTQMEYQQLEREKDNLTSEEYLKKKFELNRKSEVIQYCQISGEAPPGQIIRQILDNECDSKIEIPDWCPLENYEKDKNI